MKPKETYPKKAPICKGMIQPAVFTMFIPAPPFDNGLERKPGSQPKSPQYAKSTEAVIDVAIKVRRSKGPRKISARPTLLEPSLCSARAFKISGSGTARLIHKVMSAGNTPARKRARHP